MTAKKILTPYEQLGQDLQSDTIHMALSRNIGALRRIPDDQLPTEKQIDICISCEMPSTSCTEYIHWEESVPDGLYRCRLCKTCRDILKRFDYDAFTVCMKIWFRLHRLDLTNSGVLEEVQPMDSPVSSDDKKPIPAALPRDTRIEGAT
jgi:hypothetical protein